MIDEKAFAKRLYELRIKTTKSARDMSLSIGQSESYINKIENGKSFPTMQAFFVICDFLNISPSDFFNYDNRNPSILPDVMAKLGKLGEDEFNIIVATINKFSSKE